MRGLARDPAARFSTALQMAEALEQVGTQASPLKIGHWVRSIAADSLLARSDLLRRIEANVEDVQRPAPATTAKRPTQRDAPSASTDGTEEPTTERRRVPLGPLLAGVAVTCTLAFAGAAGWRFVRNPSVSAPSSTTSSVRSAPEVATHETATADVSGIPPPAASDLPTAKSTPPNRHAASRGPKSCNPPWVIENGNKRFKPECL